MLMFFGGCEKEVLRSCPILPNSENYIDAEFISGLEGIKGCSTDSIKKNIGVEHNVSDGMVSYCKNTAVPSSPSDKWCELVENKKGKKRGMY